MTLRVLARPAYANRSANPYNALLSDALRARGVDVAEWSTRAALTGRYDIVHLHWPEGALAMIRWPRAVQHTGTLLLAVAVARARGAAVVWTAHNLRTHEQRHRRTEQVFWRVFPRLVDAWTSLSRSSEDAVLAEHPRLARRLHAVVPHGHYRGEYEDTVSPAVARTRLGLPSDAVVLAFIGRVKEYKNVEHLVEVFHACADPRLRLVVHGLCSDDRLAARLRAQAARDARVQLRLSEVPADDMQLLLRAADLVVLPYRRILNSGSALLALSFDTPVLVPHEGSIVDLRAALGPQWVRTYDGVLDAEALQMATAEPRPPGRPPLDDLAWDVLADKVIRLYESATGLRECG